MSGDLKREIRARYVEYIVLYAIFDWPTCAITEPFYYYAASVQSFFGGTRFIGNASNMFWTVGSIITLFSGVLIAA